MGYIPIADLIAEMIPEQKILISQFYSKFDIGSGVAHKQILNVEPLLYVGAIAGSEFLTYAATKLYLCLNITLDTVAAENANDPIVQFFNEANTQNFVGSNITLEVAVGNNVIHGNNYSIKNFYFSRLLPLVAAPYQDIIFHGYRITLT